MKHGTVKNIEKELLSDHWYSLHKITFEYHKEDGTWEKQVREVYDRGNGAAILLYNREKGTVVLTKQFRMPTYMNGNPSGMMIEVCAGLLDGDHPEDCIKKEVEEETGVKGLKIENFLRTTYHIFKNNGVITLKQVHWYAMKTDYTGKLKPEKKEGIVKVKWKGPVKIQKALLNSYANIKILFEGD